MRVTNRFLQHSIAAFLLLMSASSALAEDSKSDPAAEQSFRSFHSIKAWAPRTQPIDIGDRALWERHFPSRTCTWRKQAIQAATADIAIFSSCPAYIGSRRISFEFHGKASESDLFLKRVSVDGKELGVQAYEEFIDHPFTRYGSYQTALKDDDRLRVSETAGARDITSFDNFLATASGGRYTCSVTDQSMPDNIALFCFVDAHDPEGADYADKHRPFIVILQRSKDAWILRAIHMERQSLTAPEAMLRTLFETIGLSDH